MLVKSYKDVVPYRLQKGEAKGAYIRPLISEDDGAGDYHMNLLRVEPGGRTSKNQYAYSHQMFIRKGDGELVKSSSTRELEEGDVMLIREEEKYQIRNPSDADLEVLMILPAEIKQEERPDDYDTDTGEDG
jgi:mannose-6-phosphate isomerase-like protein (cupin superfamily)